MLPALIPLAVGIASKYIPELIGSALDSDKAEKVAKVVVAHAKQAFPKDVIPALKEFDELLEKSPEQANELRVEVLDLVKLQIQDVQHAREHNTDYKATQKLGWLVMVSSIPQVLVCLGALSYITTLNLEASVLAAVSALVGGYLNQLYQERQQVMNYRFGSSLGSKTKSS